MIDSITLEHDCYPPLLRHIADPPPLLYVRGNAEILKNDCIAIVGTRAHSDYGKRTTLDLAAPLSKAGFTIISGMALGVDSLAHKTALELGRPTIAVLGCGLADEMIYPHQNLKLAHAIIASGGAVISEYAPNTRAQLFTFPARNRIISGMSKGVLVIEGDIKSGTMITAKSALDQGRDVFAIPGPIYAKKSQGTNYLIQKGAKLVAKAEDILEEYDMFLPKNEAIKADNEREAAILAVLADEPLSPDEIIRRSGLDTSTATATLMIMELNKKVRNLGKDKFVLYS